MLFCRRCHRYDCFLHKDKSVTPDLNYQSKNFNFIYQPCHSYCYRLESKSSYQQKRKKIELKRSQSEFLDKKIYSTPIKNGFHSKRLKSNLIKSEQVSSHRNGFLLKSSYKRKLNDDSFDWLSSEKSLFRIFATIFGDNICMIANLLDKSCSQVYTFYSNEKNLFLQRQLLTADGKINSEYKKRINGMMINADNEGESMEDETKICNGNDNQQSVSIEINEKSCIYVYFSAKYKSFVFSSFAFIDISSST